jgi:hypothetical protein
MSVPKLNCPVEGCALELTDVAKPQGGREKVG